MIGSGVVLLSVCMGCASEIEEILMCAKALSEIIIILIRIPNSEEGYRSREFACGLHIWLVHVGSNSLVGVRRGYASH